MLFGFQRRLTTHRVCNALPRCVIDSGHLRFVTDIGWANPDHSLAASYTANLNLRLYIKRTLREDADEGQRF
jgi:hypothetical protein